MAPATLAPPRAAAPPPAPPRAAAPPPPPATNRATTTATTSTSHASSGPLTITRGAVRRAQLVLIYGPGGIGKTSLACAAPNPVVLAVEDGVGRSLYPETPRVDVSTWSDLRAALANPALHEFQTVVLDSATRAEELAVAHTLATIKTEKGGTATSIEGYGFGKGYQHLYETFLLLLQDCQQLHIRHGRNVVLIAHDCTTTAANPEGEDYLRAEPRLSSPNSGKASIRLRLREECDSVFYLSPDINAKDGRAVGGHSRTLRSNPIAWAMTKGRLGEDPAIEPDNMPDIWAKILQ